MCRFIRESEHRDCPPSLPPPPAEIVLAVRLHTEETNYPARPRGNHVSRGIQIDPRNLVTRVGVEDKSRVLSKRVERLTVITSSEPSVSSPSDQAPSRAHSFGRLEAPMTRMHTHAHTLATHTISFLIPRVHSRTARRESSHRAIAIEITVRAIIAGNATSITVASCRLRACMRQLCITRKREYRSAGEDRSDRRSVSTSTSSSV